MWWQLCSSVAALHKGNSNTPRRTRQLSQAAYLAKVKTAAPEQIVNKASIVMMQEGKPRELQAGSNGYTCLISPDGTPLCADQNAMEWMKAIRERTDPPDKIGFIYMLAGDTGTTNHHPHQRETRLHWVQTGPHVMVVGPRVRETWRAIREPRHVARHPGSRTPCILERPMSI